MSFNKLVESVNRAMNKNRNICPYCGGETELDHASKNYFCENCGIVGDEIEEVNATGNMDGGAGPPQTPKAFSRSGKEDENNNAEWFGAKKVKSKKKNFTYADVTGESIYKTIMMDKLRVDKKVQITDNEKLSTKQKFNLSIKEFDEKLVQIEENLNRNFKLKNEYNNEYILYWKDTKDKMNEIVERLMRISYILGDTGE